MNKFSGKKILLLGTSTGSTEIVEYAHSEGAYVIVADYLPAEKSEAKLLADETYMISTTDIKSLCELGRKLKIDAVFCGVSEINLLSVRAIASELNLPCYFTKEQWELLEEKDSFKQLCQKFEIPSLKRFQIDDISTDSSSLPYPIMVKAVDRCAGVGIHICNNECEFKEYYQDSKEKSFKHKVIVEEYVVGDEFTGTINVIDGNYTLSVVYDKFLNSNIEGQLPVCEASVTPSKYSELFKQQVYEPVVNMLKYINFTNGSFFIQGIVKNNQCYVFESGLRLAGAAIYRFVEKVNHFNILKGLVDYAFFGKIDLDQKLEDYTFKDTVCCMCNITCRDGIIGKIVGMDSLSNLKTCFKIVQNYKEGDEIPRGIPLRYNFTRVYLLGPRDLIKEDLSYFQNSIKVYDTKGDLMNVKPINPDILL